MTQPSVSVSNVRQQRRRLTLRCLVTRSVVRSVGRSVVLSTRAAVGIVGIVAAAAAALPAASSLLATDDIRRGHGHGEYCWCRLAWNERRQLMCLAFPCLAPTQRQSQSLLPPCHRLRRRRRRRRCRGSHYVDERKQNHSSKHWKTLLDGDGALLRLLLVLLLLLLGPV